MFFPEAFVSKNLGRNSPGTKGLNSQLKRFAFFGKALHPKGALPLFLSDAMNITL